MDLANSLRAFTESELLVLLTIRPELAERGASNFVDLATRAMQAQSIFMAFSQLTSFEREVLDGLVHLDKAANAIDLASLPATPCDPLLIEPTLDRLRVFGLTTRFDLDSQVHEGRYPRYEVLKEVRRIIPAPFLLHPRLEKLLDRYAVPDLRTMAYNVGLPERTVGKVGLIADLLEILGKPDGVWEVLARGPHEVEPLLRSIHEDLYGMLPLDTRPWARSTIPDDVGWLLGHGLLLPLNTEIVVVAREVALALRGGAPIPAFNPFPPQVELRRDRASGSSASSVVELSPSELCDAIAAIGAAWARTPPVPLRTDGVGVKDIRLLAKAVGIEEKSIARLIELGGLAGLFAVDPYADKVGPTSAFDEWLDAEPISRWCVLAHAWAQSMTSLSRVVRRGETERSDAPLSPTWESDLTEVWRRSRLVEALGAATPGHRVDVLTVSQRARWFSPGRWGAAADYITLVKELFEEASLIGVVSGGSLNELARATLLDRSSDAIAQAAAKVFPASVDTFTVSGDLRAIAPRELMSSVLVELGLLAELASKGGATVYQFTEESLRRAFDQGRSVVSARSAT